VTERADVRRSAWRALRALGHLAPWALLGVILWMIWQQTPLVPFLDEWEMTELVQRWDRGMLNVQDIWALHVHNEHRIVISRLSSLLFIELSGWNRQVQMTFNVGLVGVTAALLVQCVRWTLGPDGLSDALLLPIALLLFSLARSGSWFQPVTDKIPTAFGVVVCMWALARGPASTWRFALAVAGALIASLSSFGGLLTWGAFAPAVWLTGWKRLGLWGAAALAVIVPYLIGFPSGTLTPDYTRETAEMLPLGDMLLYVLAFLGSSVGYPDLVRAAAFGLLGLALTAINVALLWFPKGSDRPNFQTALTWGGLAIFAIATAGAVAFGRGAGFGLSSAIASRFHTFSALWWCFVFVVAAAAGIRLMAVQSHPEESPPARLIARGALGLNVVVLSMAIAGLVWANLFGFVQSSAWLGRLRQNQDCVRHYQQADEACLVLYHWDPALTRTRAAYLAERRFAIFRDAAPADGSR
jgi:hypothetical protein